MPLTWNKHEYHFVYVIVFFTLINQGRSREQNMNNYPNLILVLIFRF